MVSNASRLFAALVALTLCAFIVVPACQCSCQMGGSFSKGVEQFLVDSFSAQGVTAATCPADAESKAGNTFTCTGTNDKGQKVTFSVTATGDDKNTVSAVITSVQ